MKKVALTVISNKKIADRTFEMKLKGDIRDMAKAGQFVDIAVDGCYLRRPVSVCDTEGDILTIIYKVVGKGTEIMSGLEAGKILDTLFALGNGYDLSASGEKPLLIGGGVGVPPLFKLCKELIAGGAGPSVVLGFNTKSEAFYADKFEALGVPVCVATADGSAGIKGFVTDAMKDMDYTYFYACGPLPMFRAIEKIAKSKGEYSFEARMGCGFGACLGCSIETKNGPKRVCKDGPVFKREEIIW